VHEIAEPARQEGVVPADHQRTKIIVRRDIIELPGAGIETLTPDSQTVGQLVLHMAEPVLVRQDRRQVARRRIFDAIAADHELRADIVAVDHLLPRAASAATDTRQWT